MRLDQLKERWLAELIRKKKVLHRISLKAVMRSTRLASHPGSTLWIQHGDWGGAFCLFQLGAHVSALNDCMHKK